MRAGDAPRGRSAPLSDYSRLPATPGGSFFSLPEWFELVSRFEAGPGDRAGFAFDEEAQIGLPLLQSKPAGTLRSCTNLYTCAFDLCGNTNNGEAIRRFASEMSSALRPPYVRLEGLDPTALSFKALCDGLRDSGYLVKPYFCWGNWYENTHAADFEAYLERRPSILSSTWRRKLALLQKSGSSKIRQFSAGEDVEPYVAAYEAAQKASWKSAETHPEFLRSLIRLAAERNALRMGILIVDDRPAAAQFWIVWNKRALIFKLVHATAFARFSPGTLLTMHMVQSILQRDAPDEIDFGRGDDGYKKLWVASRRERWGIEAASLRTRRGLFYSARLSAGLVRNFMRRRSSGFPGSPGQVA